MWSPRRYFSQSGAGRAFESQRATAALEAMGLSVSDAIRLLMLRIADEQRLPFTVQVPNSLTAKALEDLDSGNGKRFDSADELFKDLGI